MKSLIRNFSLLYTIDTGDIHYYIPIILTAVKPAGIIRDLSHSVILTVAHTIKNHLRLYEKIEMVLKGYLGSSYLILGSQIFTLSHLTLRRAFLYMDLSFDT